MIAAILQKIRPGASWNLNGDSYDGLEWLDENQVKPTPVEIESERANISIFIADQEAQKAIGTLQLEINLDHENRMRALEGVEALTREQYGTAIKNGYLTKK